MPIPDFILKRPKLVEYILEQNWLKDYSAEDEKMALQLISDKKLLGYEIYQCEEEDDIIIGCSFREKNRRRYLQSEVYIERISNYYDHHVRCTCKLPFYCHHNLALLIHTRQLLLECESVNAIARLGSTAVYNWLERISTISQTPNTPKKKKKPKSPTSFLAYCLMIWNNEVILKLKIGKRRKNELFIDTYTTPSADPTQPPRYMRDEDTFPCTLYHQHLKSFYTDHVNLSFDSHVTKRILKEAISMSRLFYIEDESSREQPANPVTLEKTITPKLDWEVLPDGSTKPTLGFSPGTIMIPSDPPYAFNKDDLTIRPISTAKFPLNLLYEWDRGPIIPAKNIHAVAPELKKVALPKPKELEKKSLKKSTPVPHLRLFRKNPFTHGGLHLSGHPEPIIAELSFLYHGHPVKPDLSNEAQQQNTFSVANRKAVFTIPRDTLKELDLIGQLIHEGKIAPIITNHTEVQKDYSSCFLPMSNPREWDFQWAIFLSTVVPQLKESGWKFDIEAESSVEFHHIREDDLLTDIEELPEQGIDWFQFKASYTTPDGKRVSILPLLSQFLKSIDINRIEEDLTQLKGDETSIIENPDTGLFVSVNSKQFLSLAKNVYELFGMTSPDDPIHRVQASQVAESLEMDASQTLRTLAQLGKNLKNITSLPKPKVPASVKAELRHYQLDGFHWLQFLSKHGLHGILADDMGLGKTLQTLTHIQAEVSSRRTKKRPSLVIAPTSVVGNWKAEAAKFTPNLKVLLYHGPQRKEHISEISDHHLILTTYGLLVRDFDILQKHQYHILALDEAQYIKNPTSQASKQVCKLKAAHRISLSGTPIENHLGELWAQMRFLMPGILGSQQSFRKHFRTPIEKHHDQSAQNALNRRVAPLILRRTKDEVATELPPKTEILHSIPLNKQQVDIYETVRAAMDKRIREAVSEKGLDKSHIIVLDALLKLRQICCHPKLLKLPAAQKIQHSAKLDFLTTELLPTLIEEGRKILLFSSFTSMLDLIEDHIKKQQIPYSKIVGKTLKRQEQIEQFQQGDSQIFLISLKAGGTGLNLTAADTVIHYDPWWNPAAENQATDRAHRIGQTKPVFVHKLISNGTIEQKIQELQAQKSALVDAFLTADTNKLKIDTETLNDLLAPIENMGE